MKVKAMENQPPQCARCPYDWPERFCHGESGKAPRDCPSLRHADLIRQSLEEVQSAAVCEFARQASVQEAAGYGRKEEGYARVRPIKPRIEEIIEFARRMHFQRLGLIFCVGLRREAAVVQDIFERHGLEMISVVCKVGRISKEVLGLTGDEQIDAGAVESMCNPIAQALLANHYQTHFNVLLGLCVGHDSLFFRYASAPCTVLAVKDRLLGHNPLAAIYQADSYYRYLGRPGKERSPSQNRQGPEASAEE
jgi:uncharacterized metal-binding protein